MADLPYDNIEVAIVDPTTGKAATVTADNELLVKINSSLSASQQIQVRNAAGASTDVGYRTADVALPIGVVEIVPPTLPDGSRRALRLDANGALVISGGAVALVATDYIYDQLQRGKLFNMYDYLSNLASGQTRDVLVITGAKEAHFTFAVTMADEATILLYEAPTTTANGNALAVNNRNRTSTNTALLTAFFAPTVTGVGAMIDRYLSCYKGGSPSSGATINFTMGSRPDNEVIMKANTKYLIRIVSSANVNAYQLNARFFEV